MWWAQWSWRPLVTFRKASVHFNEISITNSDRNIRFWRSDWFFFRSIMKTSNFIRMWLAHRFRFESRNFRVWSSDLCTFVASVSISYWWSYNRNWRNGFIVFRYVWKASGSPFRLFEVQTFILNAPTGGMSLLLSRHEPSWFAVSFLNISTLGKRKKRKNFFRRKLLNCQLAIKFKV